MSKFKFKIAWKVAGFATILWCLWLGRPVSAQMIAGESAVPLGFCQLAPTASTGLASCSGGIPAGANAAAIQAATAAVSYRDDGVAPTASVGMQLPTGVPPIWYSGTLSALRFISPTGSVNVLFYKVP